MHPPIPDEALEQCLVMLADGKTLTDCAKELGYGRPTLSKRLRQTPEIEARYEQAVKEGIECSLDEAFQAATAAKDAFEVQKARLIADNAKWFAAKRHAQVFGDKIEADVTDRLNIFLGIRRKSVEDKTVVSEQ